MTVDLEKLRIDRTGETRTRARGKWSVAAAGVIVLLSAAGALIYRNKAGRATAAQQTAAVVPPAPEPGAEEPLLTASGYIVAAHKIEVAAKVVGKVAWVGVEKGDRVKEGQLLVRLEDEEYRAQVLQAEGSLESLEARLAALEHGSRPEEIAKAKADLDSARADLENDRLSLERWSRLARDGVAARQDLDNAQAKFEAQEGKVASLERTYELARVGPRREDVDAARAQVKQARGALEYAKAQLEDAIIRAPVSGTILERNVEKGEFVTTGFVGDRGAKGYVVSLADLNDLEVELDINQNDFARLQPRQVAVVTTDAYPDRMYVGFLCEMSPEANRQKATVQVKVRIEKPDRFLRPDMNASVIFRREVRGAAPGGV